MRVAVSAVEDVVPHAADIEAAAHLPAFRARESVAARGLLRSLLAELGEIKIAAHDTGQPFLPEHPELTISLAHDGAYVAAACRRGKGLGVGVDVQVPVPASPGLLRRCGVAELAELPERERDLEFAWVWTVQEACVKATGQGLSGRPWAIPVRRGQTSGRWHGVRWSRLRHSAVPVSVAFQEAR